MLSAIATTARADPPPPPLSVALRETFDLWSVPAGVRTGIVVLNKLQASATLSGDHFGLPGWSMHAQLFRFDGQSLSARQGDIQTADNLEAPPVTRLFEAWLARQWGGEYRSVAVRVGLIDLNSQFDSIDPASLFVNSSHGIGPDLSRSGRNGPSIYPVSAPGATLTLVPSSRLAIRVGLFDGVPGDPDRPRAFVAETLRRSNGTLGIGEIDWSLAKDARLALGGWHYTAAAPGPDGTLARDSGAYASLQGSLPIAPRTTGWMRTGLANRRAQAVAAYWGAGVVQQGTFANRPEDRLGLAIAHAIIAPGAVGALGISSAETSFELSYQAKLSERIAVQPDVQYLHHPAGIAGAPDSVGLGVRLVLSTGFPTKPKATDPTDPTVPPDGAPTTAPSDAAPADQPPPKT